jgi:DNA ligase-4
VIANSRVILDGEMIAWDPVNQAIVPFGNLKTAALTEKENRSSKDGMHPLCWC